MFQHQQQQQIRRFKHKNKKQKQKKNKTHIFLQQKKPFNIGAMFNNLNFN